jgi:hypothetical protein
MKRIPKYSVVKIIADGEFYITKDILPTRSEATASCYEWRRDNLEGTYEIKKEWVNKKKRSWR